MVHSIVSEAVLQAARELNARDAKQAALASEENILDDDEVWANTEGVEGLKGKDGQALKIARSCYSTGPYPRNRRILADVALCAGWDADRAKEFEAECVKRAAKEYKACEKPCLLEQWDFTDPENPMKKGRPFTFQDIAWDRLKWLIERVLDEMDHEKKAAVRAGVIEMYASNSITGKKKLPLRGTKRKHSDGPEEGEIAQAQEDINREQRYHDAVVMPIERPQDFREPDWVKRRLVALEKKGKLDVADFCTSIGATVDEYRAFINARKKEEKYRNMVYHEGLKFFLKRERESLEGKASKKPRTSEDKENNEAVARAD